MGVGAAALAESPLGIVKRPKASRASSSSRGAGSWNGPSAGWAVPAAYPKIIVVTQTSEAMICVAMIHLMVRRLARLTSFTLSDYSTSLAFTLFSNSIISSFIFSICKLSSSSC